MIWHEYILWRSIFIFQQCCLCNPINFFCLVTLWAIKQMFTTPDTVLIILTIPTRAMMAENEDIVEYKLPFPKTTTVMRSICFEHYHLCCCYNFL